MSISGIHLNKRGVLVLFGLISLYFVYKYSGSKEAKSYGKVDLSKLLQVAIKAAENGGVQVRNKANDNLKIHSKGLTKEGAQDRVTEADFLSHCSMVQTLKHFFPSLTVISEEEKTNCNDFTTSDRFTDLDGGDTSSSGELIDVNDITVWVDPLDATQEYTEKLYKFVTTMVCVAVKGKPLIGVIHKPFEKETFWAWVGKSHSANLNVQNEGPEKIKVTISRSHAGKIKAQLGDKYEIVESGGSGYKALEIAARRVSVYLHITAIKKWDICAGNAILDALNGIMTTQLGATIDYTNLTSVYNKDGIIASYSQKIHDMFVVKPY